MAPFLRAPGALFVLDNLIITIIYDCYIYIYHLCITNHLEDLISIMLTKSKPIEQYFFNDLKCYTYSYTLGI